MPSGTASGRPHRRRPPWLAGEWTVPLRSALLPRGGSPERRERLPAPAGWKEATMARLTPLIFLPAFALANHQHGAESDVSLMGFKGTLLNENGPYLVRADHGALYRCEWLGGSNRWIEGDRVYVTRTSGMADMIKLGEDTSARVWVEEVDMGIGRARLP